MKRQLRNTIIDLLQETEQETLVLTCMDFQVEIAGVSNHRIFVMPVLAMDLERCCPETLQSIADQIQNQGIKQVLILEHHCCHINDRLLTDFDKTARWFDLAEKLREKRLQFHSDGVSLLDSKEYAFSHARIQLNYLKSFLRKCASNTATPRLRSIVVDPCLGYKELINIELSSFRN